MKSIKSVYLALLLAVLAITATTYAQTVVTGELSGVVTDPTGAAIVAGKVVLKSDATGETQTAQTNATGEFRFALLRPGTYTLVVSATGFQDSTLKAGINLGQVAKITVQLGLQAQTQVVNVNEQISLVQSENANIATSFNAKQLENLPTPGNDMTAYAFTTPGVSASTGGGYGSFSAFGLPGVANLFTINGNDNMDPYLNLNNTGASNLTLGNNEIEAAAVVLNGYTGQYGRQAGAQVNYITKSGTNEFHGNAVWQWNGSKLNANDWFNNQSGTERPHAVSNQWAASLGGPIVKNKLFFYFDNEGMRYVLPSGGPVYIPTTAFMNYILGNLKTNNAAAVPLYTTAANLWANSSGANRATPLGKADDAALGCGDFAGTGAWGVTQPCAAIFQGAVNSLNTEMAARRQGRLESDHQRSVLLPLQHGSRRPGDWHRPDQSRI